jgi:uncharacterized membrane protein YjfL (UPF0719 family)
MIIPSILREIYNFIPDFIISHVKYSFYVNILFQIAVTIVYRKTTTFKEMDDLRRQAAFASLLWQISLPASMMGLAAWIPYAIFYNVR